MEGHRNTPLVSHLLALSAYPRIQVMRGGPLSYNPYPYPPLAQYPHHQQQRPTQVTQNVVAASNPIGKENAAPNQHPKAVAKRVASKKAVLSSSNKTASKDQSSSAPSEEKTESSSSNTTKTRKIVYKSIEDVILEEELEGVQVPVYDDCDSIRRKIRALQKTPGFKVTHWLRNNGDINSNSLRQFMKQTGYNSGAGNIAYYRAYIYFEKKRIFEGKRKSATRLENEANYPDGYELKTDTKMYIYGIDHFL